MAGDSLLKRSDPAPGAVESGDRALPKTRGTPLDARAALAAIWEADPHQTGVAAAARLVAAGGIRVSEDTARKYRPAHLPPFLRGGGRQAELRIVRPPPVDDPAAIGARAAAIREAGLRGMLDRNGGRTWPLRRP
jgi:hypothetical protein